MRLYPLLVLIPITCLVALALWRRIVSRQTFRRAVHALGHPDFFYDGPDGFVDSGSSIALHTRHRLVHLRRGRRWRSYPLDAVRGWEAPRRPAPGRGELVVRVDDPAAPEWRIDMPSLEQRTWCELLALAVSPAQGAQPPQPGAPGPL